ncbi:MAG: hypothetical protein WCI48_11515 [Bacteroidota bacterium]|jgi:hypothetical protein
MKTKLLYTFLILLPVTGFSQSQGINPAATVPPIKFMATSAVIGDLEQNGKASKYFEPAQDLIYLDETLILALNTIQPGVVSQENIDMIKYMNSRDQKPYREVWDHNVYMKYSTTISDIRQLLTDQNALTDLKKRLGREFNRLDPGVFINGNDRIMFILRSPGSEAGSFYRAILTAGYIRIDEISNWRDS